MQCMYLYILAKLAPLLLDDRAAGKNWNLHFHSLQHQFHNTKYIKFCSSFKLKKKIWTLSIFALRNSKKILKFWMKMRVHIFFTSSTSSTAVAIGKATIINGLLPQNSLPILSIRIKVIATFCKSCIQGSRTCASR